MTAHPMVRLIQRGEASQPLPEFIHDLTPLGFGWSRDRSRARRFKTRADAERLADDILSGQFHASPHALRDLVRQASASHITPEADDFVAL